MSTPLNAGSNSTNSNSPSSTTQNVNFQDPSTSPLAAIRIVLVEPQGPINLGAAARVMTNMGLSQLVLINPICSPADPEAVRMAVRGIDVLKAARQVSSLSEALQGCQRVVGTVGRSQASDYVYPDRPENVMPWFLTNLESAQPNNLAMVFGPEDRGLDNAELSLCHKHLAIPTSSVYPSLNLGQAVGICAYELHRWAIEPFHRLNQLDDAGTGDRPAPHEMVEGFYSHLERLLLQIGYLYPHTAQSRMLKFRRLFNRVILTRHDIGMLRGVLRQLMWADNHSNHQPSSTSPDRPSRDR